MADDLVLLTITELLAAVGGIVLANDSSATGVSGVVTDSRAAGPGVLFVPLIGEFQDGHRYIQDALQAGACCVFVDSAHADKDSKLYSDLALRNHSCVITVSNTLKALQDAARYYVSKFPDLLKIGVTGSSGKTTTKEILAALFQERFSVVMNEGNLNSETGLPLSVFRIRSTHEVGIFELGMNRRGEIAEIARVLSPDLALITNIGTAHIGILGSKTAIAEEKKSIFSFFTEHCVGFVPERDEWTAFLTDIPKGNVITYGRFATKGIERTVDLGIEGTLIRYHGNDIRFPLPGTYNLQNAIGAIAVAGHAGLTPAEISCGLSRVRPLFGRGQIISGPRTVILDCYNANPDSMEKAIEFCSVLDWSGRKIFVLGSMLELGEESGLEHERVCVQVARSDADTVILFGQEMTDAGAHTEWGRIACHLCPTIDDVRSALEETVRDGDLVFLKGSRGMALERVMPAIMSRPDTGAFHD